ncbi:MAG: hypothetical protein NXY57DRAFT_1105739 [Lentinula lateritia]|nr:MAG: hypothetical protein NXY57DRAFT_1105739 [Lentinula lateritia]
MCIVLQRTTERPTWIPLPNIIPSKCPGHEVYNILPRFSKLRTIRSDKCLCNSSFRFSYSDTASSSSRRARVIPFRSPIGYIQERASKRTPSSYPSSTPTLSTGDPIVTYQTHFLGLFSGDGEMPIATTIRQFRRSLRIWCLQGRYILLSTITILRFQPGVPQAKVIEDDFDYVGGCIADAGGKQQYVSRGHIEEIEEGTERNVEIPSGSNPAGPSAIAGPSSRFLGALSLPASTAPPPRPMLRTKRDPPLSQSDSGSNNHAFHRPFFTKHKPLATTHQLAASPLSQSVSSLAHMPLRGFTSLRHTGGQGPTGPEQNTFFGPSASHHADVDMRYEPLPVGSPPFDPLADSLSSLPGLRGFAPLTPNTLLNRLHPQTIRAFYVSCVRIVRTLY